MSPVETLEQERALLCERFQIYLDELPSVLHGDVMAALQVEGKLLHRPASALDGRWALLPFCLARDLHPDVEVGYACGVALAVECVIGATDLCDDVMDGDITPLVNSLGVARMLNVALTLLSLALRILHSLAEPGVPSAPLIRLQNGVQSALLLALAGQQRDLLAEDKSACELSREECLAIAGGKAGTLLSLACQFGAICAGADETQIEQCSEMGRWLGIAAQLDNDAHDLSLLLQPFAQSTPAASQKSDLARGKKTLPVVLAAHSLRAKRALDHWDIDAAFRQLALLTGEERDICLHALREGILATWAIALLYRERARDCFARLEQDASLSAGLRHVLGLAEMLVTIEER